MAFAPSSPISFCNKLQKRVKWRCQRLLTVGFEACGGVLEVGEGRVDLKRLSDVLCALWSELVVVETANNAKIAVSAAADSRD